MGKFKIIVKIPSGSWYSEKIIMIENIIQCKKAFVPPHMKTKTNVNTLERIL